MNLCIDAVVVLVEGRVCSAKLEELRLPGRFSMRVQNRSLKKKQQ
jgi:hypothetical protein